MQIVIDIPEKTYKELKAVTVTHAGEQFAQRLIRYIVRGTPLPKGHGRLIDVDEIDNYMLPSEKQDKTWFVHSEEYRNAVPHFNHAMRLLRDNAPTIIPADKEENE